MMRGQTKWTRIVLPVLAAATWTACGDDGSEDTVQVRESTTADFSAYQTFAFARQSQPPAVAIPADVQADLTNLDEAVRSELVDLGLTEVDLATPPDLVVFSLASTDSEQALTWGCGGGYWWGYWSWGWDPCAWIEPVYVDYEVGTAFVGLVDESASTIVFAGLIEGVLTDEGDLNERIEDDVDAMFDEYPED